MQDHREHIKKYHIYTLGCRVNQYESDALAGELSARGWSEAASPEDAQLVVLNSCTVTREAGRKSAQILRRLRQQNPGAFLVAWGCQVEMGDRPFDCELCLGNQRKGEAAELILRAMAEAGEREADSVGAQPRGPIAWPAGFLRPEGLAALATSSDATVAGGRGAGQAAGAVASGVETRFSSFDATARPRESRAYLKVQDGCYHHCTYCAIRLVRGPSRSRPLGEVLQEARALAEQGYREIQLVGIHLSAYGEDLPEALDLGDLCLALEEIPGIENLRLGSLEPEIIRPEVVAKFRRCEKLCPHLHLALQSGSASVLRRMGRGYSKAEYRAAVELLRERWPGLELATDLMVGFVGETEEEHRESLAFVEEVGFASYHIFRYSPRPGTPAAIHEAKLGGPVPKAVQHRRWEEAEALRQRLEREAFVRHVGREDRVMIEGTTPFHGYTRSYLPTTLAGELPRDLAQDLEEEDLVGRILPVRIVDFEAGNLKGEILW